MQATKIIQKEQQNFNKICLIAKIPVRKDIKTATEKKLKKQITATLEQLFR